MKKSLLYLLFTISFFSNAQIWCPPGALWHHTLTPYPNIPKTGVVEDRYIGDTLLAGKQCKKIRETFTGKVSPLSPVSSSSVMIYSYLESGVLYLYTNGVFDTIVNFNASIGDSWLRNRFLGNSCNPRQLVTVTDTGRKVINNMSLKWISTTYTGTYSTVQGGNVSMHTVNDTIIERIMTTYDYLFPMYCEMNHPHGLDMMRRGELICYQDNKFGSYKRSGYTHCEYTTTSIPTIRGVDNGLRVYPNPVSDYLHLEIKRSGIYTFQITDVMGRLIMEEKINTSNQQINMAPLQRGVYFIKIINDEGLNLTEKIIKE